VTQQLALDWNAVQHHQVAVQTDRQHAERCMVEQSDAHQHHVRQQTQPAPFIASDDDLPSIFFDPPVTA